MSKLVLNRDGGSADEYGHLLALNRLLTGDVIQGMNVTQDTGSNMATRVQPGTARISTGTGATAYGYFVGVDTSAGEQVTIGTANASNPRIDLIVAYVDKGVSPTTSTANNPNNMLKLIAVQGTPAATAQYPTQAAIQSAVGAANPYIVLGQVYVSAGVTSITASNITDIRTMAMTRSGAVQNSIAAAETRANSSYGTLATAGPEVKAMVGASGMAMVSLSVGNMFNNTASANAFMSFAMSGANSANATDTYNIHVLASAANVPQIGGANTFLLTGLNPGLTTFTAQYRSNGADTASFENRRIAVLPL